MSFDLRSAPLRKQEVETARLLDFEFRLRARAMRLLADELDEDGGVLVARIVHDDETTIVADLAGRHGLAIDDLLARWSHCRERARGQLVAEQGDPTPHRLA